MTAMDARVIGRPCSMPQAREGSKTVALALPAAVFVACFVKEQEINRCGVPPWLKCTKIYTIKQDS